MRMNPYPAPQAFMEHLHFLFDANGRQCQHNNTTTVNCPPSGPAGGMPVVVSGNLQLAGERHTLNFSQAVSRERERENQVLMDPDAAAKAFVEHYYSTFYANRAYLANLYQESSMLTFEGEKIRGSPNIVAKLTSLPFQQCQHSITTVDFQPSGPAGGLLVFVSGNLQLAGEQHARKFSQMFHLMPTPQGTFYVLNDIFRLNYA